METIKTGFFPPLPAVRWWISKVYSGNDGRTNMATPNPAAEPRLPEHPTGFTTTKWWLLYQTPEVTSMSTHSPHFWLQHNETLRWTDRFWFVSSGSEWSRWTGLSSHTNSGSGLRFHSAAFPHLLMRRCQTQWLPWQRAHRVPGDVLPSVVLVTLTGFR